MVKRIACLLLAASACNTGFEKESIVIDLRVLAIRADPPEVVVDVDPTQPTNVALPPVVITTLVADPQGPRALRYSMTACGATLSRRCDDPEAPSFRFAEGPVDTMLPQGTLQADVPLLQAALAADTLKGLGGVPVQIEVVIEPEGGEAVHASKRVTFAPRIPPGRVANSNPTLADLLANGQSFSADAPLVAAPRTVMTLEPVEPDGVRETYVLPTLDGDTRTFTENLTYAWFATAGDFRDEVTGGPTDIFGNVPLLRTRWQAPEKPGLVTLWVVQRDERGGTYWTTRQIMVQN